jgi:alpha-D-ribose 1-methylphosphonate 5-triphosphate synthase subunit PhnL
MYIPPILKGAMPPEVLIFTSFRQRVVVAVVEQVVAVVVVARQQVVAVERVVVAVVEQAAVVVERVAAVQQAFAPLQAVPQAFAGKKLPTELCLPLQVAIAFSFCLPPKKFYSYYILILNRLSSFL